MAQLTARGPDDRTDLGGVGGAIDALELDAIGHVPWWGDGGADVTLHRILVHLVAEVARHAGHMDLLREQVDGAAGLRVSGANLPDHDAAAWAAYVERLRAIAEAAPAD